MAGQIARALASEFPEYLELNSILKLAALTWPRYGLSAADLSRLDRWTAEVLRAIVEG